MAFLLACTVLQAVYVHVFSSLPSRLVCRERLYLLAFAPAEQFSFQSLLKSTPGDVSSVLLKPCALLALCNCDCKVITASVCFWPTKFCIECIHLSQRCITTTFLRSFFGPVTLRGIDNNSMTSVEHADAARGQFAMVGGHGCPASGYWFTMAFDPVHRWLMSSLPPPEPHRPWLLQRCACAYADDFALAPASLRESFWAVAKAFSTIDALLTTRSLIEYNMGTWPFHSSRNGSALTSQSSGKCRSRTLTNT